MSSVVFSRFGSLVAQIVAGWYLLPTEFGLFAAVFSISAILISVRNGGLFTFLLHLEKADRNRYLLLASYLNYCLFFLCILFAIFQDDSEKFYLFAIFSLCLLISRCVIALRVHYAIRQDFKAISKLDVYNSIVQHGGLIACIYLDFGVYSLALPYLFVSILEFILCVKNKDIQLEWFGNISLDSVGPMFAKAKWPLLTAFVMGLSQQGDFVALSISSSAYILGVYFFGFQLTAAAGQLIIIVTRSVLTPALVKVKNDPVQYWSDFNFYFSLILIASVIGCTSGFILSNPIISIIWGEKWIDVIAVVNLLLIGLLARVISAVIYAMLDSLGQFKSKFLIILVDSVIIFFTALISGYSNDLITISANIATVQIVSLLSCMIYIKFMMKLKLQTKKILETLLGLSFIIFVWYNVTHMKPPILYDVNHGIEYLNIKNTLFLFAGSLTFGLIVLSNEIKSTIKKHYIKAFK